MKTCSRRQFAMSLGASLLLAPFAKLLAGGGQAQAAPQKTARRLIVFFNPNGTIPRLWAPSGTAASYQFPAGSVLEPLIPNMKDIVVLNGIDFINTNNHSPGMAAMLTGNGATGNVGGGMSVDQYVAGAIGQNSRFSSLQFGVQTSDWGGNVQTRMSYSAPGQFVTPEDDPVNSYQLMFGAATGGSAALLLQRRKSTLDLITAEITDLRSRLGHEEQMKLDQHTAAIRSVEQSLMPTGGCTSPTPPMQIDAYSQPNFPTLGKSQMDLMVTALSCDMTRVASIQWSHTVAPTVFSWDSIEEGHHDLSHSDDSNTTGVNQFIACERWYAQQFGYLINALKATPDPVAGGTLFDSTLVLWAKELGDSRLHICQSVPFVLAGNAGGALQTGRYLQFSHAPHVQLLTSVCQIMGLTNNSFGDPTAGTGPLPGLV